MDEHVKVTPVENDLDKIKKIIDGGGYITIPPDHTPIHNIPFQPQEMPKSIPIQPVDWDSIKKHLDGGGKINTFPSKPAK